MRNPGLSAASTPDCPCISHHIALAILPQAVIYTCLRIHRVSTRAGILQLYNWAEMPLETTTAITSHIKNAACLPVRHHRGLTTDRDQLIDMRRIKYGHHGRLLTRHEQVLTRELSVRRCPRSCDKSFCNMACGPHGSQDYVMRCTVI
jgi:hypothetical protein